MLALSRRETGADYSLIPYPLYGAGEGLVNANFMQDRKNAARRLRMVNA